MVFILGNPIQPLAFASIAAETAIGICLWCIAKRLVSMTGVQVNISAQVPIVSLVFNRERFVASLKQESSRSISFSVPVRISRKPMLHTSAQIWLGRFDQRMNVIWHPTKRQHDPATPGNFVAQSLRKSLLVSIIVKQRLTPVSASHQMIYRTGILKPRRTRHTTSPILK